MVEPPASSTQSACLERQSPANTVSRSYLLFGLSTGHAAVLGLAGWLLPWEFSWLFTAPVTALAVGYAALAFACLACSVIWRRRLWVVVSVGSLLFYGVLVSLVLSWGLYLTDLYQKIGMTLSAGLAVVCLALGAFFVPLPVACLVTWRHQWGKLGAVAMVTAGVMALGGASMPNPALAAPDERRLELEQALLEVAEAPRRAAPGEVEEKAGHLSPRHAVGRRLAALSTVRNGRCDYDLHARRAWLVTLWGSEDQEVHCLQGASQTQQLARLEELLRERALPGTPIKLDIVKETTRLRATWPLLDALRLRPGQDGLCVAQRCNTPHQLVFRGAFTSLRPLPGVPDAAFGIDLQRIAHAIDKKAPAGAPLTRFTTESFLLRPPHTGDSRWQLIRTKDMGKPTAPVQLDTVRQAVEDARDYIVRSQQQDGTFVYMYTPRGDKKEGGRLNLPRHAGTTLALCEVAQGSRREQAAIAKALSSLAKHEHRLDDLSFLSAGGARAQLGDTALPLIALLECRKLGWVDKAYEALGRRLGRFVLNMQRKDGSFHPEYDPGLEAPVGQHEALYASGQAVYALLLLEEAADHEGDTELQHRLHEAVELAMNHYSGPYWGRGLGDFFYLEENWHCLAARAALEFHRHAAYEDFCIDYVRFRLRLHEGEDAVLGQKGGYTLSPLFPPHITPTAGTAEAGSAALTIASARGEKLPEIESALKLALGYLLRHQLDAETCFWCLRPRYAHGAFPENPVSRIVRIDYVQHAMAGLFHTGQHLYGDRFLRLTPSPSNANPSGKP